MWSLDQHCEDKYQLFEKAGVAHSDAHRAGADSLVLHYLVEEHRKLAGLAADIGEVTDTTKILIHHIRFAYPSGQVEFRGIQ